MSNILLLAPSEWNECGQTDPAALSAQRQAGSKAGGNAVQGPVFRLPDQGSCSCQGADGE